VARVIQTVRALNRFAILQCSGLLLQCDNQLNAAGTGAQRSGAMLKFLRKYTAIPAVKYSLIAIASLLWIVGFADQLHDVTQTAKYVGISLLMVAVAAMA